MKQRHLLFIILVGFIVFNFYIGKALASDIVGTGGGGLINPLGNATIIGIFQNIIKFFIEIGAPITAIVVLYGGYLILTAGDKPDQVTEGQKAILYAAVGYAIVLSAWGIIAIIKEILGATGGS